MRQMAVRGLGLALVAALIQSPNRMAIKDPSTEVPTAPPILRKNCKEAVTTPSVLWGKAFWTAIMYSGNVTPRPAPTITMFRMASALLVPGPIVERR